MERIVLILLGVMAFATYSSAGGMLGSASSSNVDSMLQNPVVVQRQIRCLLCRGPCDRIGQELKIVLPRVGATQCRHCSTTEKVNLGKIISHVQTHYPKEWAELNAAMRSGRRCK